MILILGGGRLARRIKGGREKFKIVPHQELNVCSTRAVTDYLYMAASNGATVVINCAADTDVGAVEVSRTSAVNSVAPGLIALACSSFGLRMIHVSTDYVFGGGILGPYSVTDKPYPLQYYGHSKLMGEWATSLAPAVVVRIGWIFGPEYPNNAVMKAATGPQDETYGIWNDIVGTPTHVAEAAAAIRGVALSLDATWLGYEPPLLIHVSSGEDPISWFDFLKGAYPKINPVPSPRTLRRPRVGGLVPNDWGATAPYDQMLLQFQEELASQNQNLPGFTRR